VGVGRHEVQIVHGAVSGAGTAENGDSGQDGEHAQRSADAGPA
jgi:hypothetical protein